MLVYVLALAFACFICCSLAGVVITSQPQVIYEDSLYVHFNATGLSWNSSFQLTLGASGEPALKGLVDYIVFKGEKGDFQLNWQNRRNGRNTRKWVTFGIRMPPADLLLSAVKFKSCPIPDTNQLHGGPVVLARVLASPLVHRYRDVRILSTARDLRVYGRFVGAAKVHLTFMPALREGVDYDDVTNYASRTNQITLRLRPQRVWRSSAGPLYVMSTDAGAGRVEMKFEGKVGTKVAEIVDTLTPNKATLKCSTKPHPIYDDVNELVLSRSDFKAGDRFLFADSKLGTFVLTANASTGSSVVLRRPSASFVWRTDVWSKPRPLTLLSVDTGNGFAAVGPADSGKGCDVAMVYKRPTLKRDGNTDLVHTNTSAMLFVRGTGFPYQNGLKVRLRLSPPLVQDVDFVVNEYYSTRKQLVLQLKAGRAWRAEPGLLTVTHINTRPDEGGWFALPAGGVIVAGVVSDQDRATFGAVQILASSQKVYQTTLQQSIRLRGAGFVSGMSLVLSPPLVQDLDYTLQVLSNTEAVLRLQAGRSWRAEVGWLVVRAVQVSQQEPAKSSSPGVCIAGVLADPAVNKPGSTVPQLVLNGREVDQLDIPGSHFVSHVFGRSFHSISIKLDPPPASIRVRSSVDGTVLEVTHLSWPSSLVARGASAPLKLVSIDTGAGEIVLPSPLVVATLVSKRPLRTKAAPATSQYSTNTSPEENWMDDADSVAEDINTTDLDDDHRNENYIDHPPPRFKWEVPPQVRAWLAEELPAAVQAPPQTSIMHHAVIESNPVHDRTSLLSVVLVVAVGAAVVYFLCCARRCRSKTDSPRRGGLIESMEPKSRWEK